MSKHSSKKSKRRSKALPALGFAGASLSMASGACASTTEASANTPPASQPHELFLGEEEIFDTSLSTFYTFDKENGGAPSLAPTLKIGSWRWLRMRPWRWLRMWPWRWLWMWPWRWLRWLAWRLRRLAWRLRIPPFLQMRRPFLQGLRLWWLRRLRLRRLRDLLDMATSWLVLGRVYTSG
jgi:hypothetical protein